MDLEQLYQEVYPKLYAFFYARTSSREASEDLTQEVFCEAIRGAEAFRGQASVRTWLFAIARRKLSRYYRSKRYGSGLKHRLAREHRDRRGAGIEEQVVRSEGERMLLERINGLREPEKEIVLLRIYGELSFREIGALVGISENHARVVFHRIKIRLQREMGENDG
jgi:RNA polymerase sigma-70 factor (ECF subfamily)